MGGTETIREVEALASKILRKYFCDSDVEYLISTFAPDIVWLGGGDKMQAEGAEAVAAYFRGGADALVPCDMTDERYVTMPLGEDYYLCEGDSWLQPKSGTQLYFKMHQRVTFVFRRTPDGLKAVHIHNSVPYSEMQDDEMFPVRAAREAYEQLQKILVQRDNQIELMLSQLPGGMMICQPDQDFSTIWISEGLCRLLGYSDVDEYIEATGNCCRGFIVPEDYDRMLRKVDTSLSHGETYYSEYRAIRKDGSILWVADFGKRTPGLNGERSVINCFISDISERKTRDLEIEHANQEVQRQAKFLSQLYNTVPFGILQFTPGPDYQIVNINRMGWEFYGFHSEEDYLAHVQNPLQLVLDQERGKIQQMVDSLVLDGEPCTYTREGRRWDGTPVWMNVVMQRLINADGLEVFQAVFNDITEMRTLQIAQQEEQMIENKSLRAAICTAYPLILSVNLTKDRYRCFIEEQDTYVIARRQGSFDQLVADTLPQVYPSYREQFAATFSREAILRNFAQGARELYMEFQQQGVDGEYHWISVQLIYVDNPVDEDVLAIELIKSLDTQRAERARQEQLLRDALASAEAANSAKSDFLSRMSHDIRTPMNAIIGMSTIGQLKTDDPARVQDCFQKIDASSRYLLSLINDILDMSKIETGKMELSKSQFDLTELIGEINTIIFPQALAQKIRFDFHHKEPLDRYYRGDSLRIKQILMNLLSNALKFTPSGGAVTVSLEESHRTNGFSYLRFTVSDTGVGISKDFMRRLFKPFEQESAGTARNNVGSGLGLAIVYNLVQLMSGTIEVQSEQGEGTTFRFSIPLEQVEPDEARERQRKSTELLKGFQVLVVDDDPLVGDQAAGILNEIGATSVWVDSGLKAVELVRARLETNSCFDVAMIDWRMPDMDGLETTRRVRELVGPETMIIIISAYDWSAIESDARAAGADYFISKPLFRSTIYDTFLQLGMEGARRQDVAVPLRTPSPRPILLVEDNQLNLEIAQSLLEMYGFQVDSAENGRIAVEKFAASLPNHYLAVLMDIRMPVMDGLQATQAIRALNRPDAASTSIIAMSANAFEEDRVQALQAGVSDYLVKPLDIHVLLQALDRLAQ